MAKYQTIYCKNHKKTKITKMKKITFKVLKIIRNLKIMIIGGELLLYVNENLPGKIINSYNFKENSEIILFEISVSNKKWLLLDNCRPPSQNDLSFINELNLALNFFSPVYQNFVLLCDFILSTENPNLKNFMCSFDRESLIDSPTCYQSINPTCIGLILTNKKNHFMKSATFVTGLSP